tara:strand:+ start:15710 stop:15880 length:171 start_codon:yes stop_codon:yes gene_type:complete
MVVLVFNVAFFGNINKLFSFYIHQSNLVNPFYFHFIYPQDVIYGTSSNTLLQPKNS